MMQSPFPTYQELPQHEGSLYPDAWGVFGAEDRLGTLNQLTPERVLEAKHSIRTGRVINLNLSLNFFTPALISHRGLVQHEIFGLNEFHRDERLDSFFTQASTQIDSLRHFAHPDRGFYNGVSGEILDTEHGDLSMHEVAEHGITGRGILIDVARYRESIGRPITTMSDEQLTVEDLENTLAHQGTTLQPGDILLLRTGWIADYRKGLHTPGSPVLSAGLAQSEEIAAWLWNNQPAMIAADNLAVEAWPANRVNLPTIAEQEGRMEPSSHTGMLHRLLIGLLGFTLGELWDLDELAEHCAVSGHYDVFLTAEPLNLVGGAGSPANALAIV